MIEASSFVIVLTTFPVEGDVTAFARTLVDERLAACVNILPPMESIYRWERAIEQATEHQLIIKTSAARVEDLKTRIATLHAYEVPEILVLPVEGGGESYLMWIADNVEGTR